MTSDKIEEINTLLHELEKLKLTSSEKTIQFAENVMHLCQEIDYELGIAISNLYMAEAKCNLGDIETSLVMTFNALDCFIKEGFYDLQWQAFNSLGVTFSTIGDFDNSTNYYFKAESIIHKIDSNRKFAQTFSSDKAKVLTLNNISEDFKLLKAYDIALKYCKEAYLIDKKQNFILSHGVSALSLGEIYYLIGNYEKANSLAICSLKYLKLYNYVLAEVDTYELLALTFWKQGDFNNASKYYKLLIEMMSNHHIPVYNEVNIYINFYSYLEEQGDLCGAIDALLHACELAVNNNMHGKICEISGLIAKFYEKSGDTALAYKYYKMHSEYDLLRLKSINQQILNNIKVKKKVHQIETEKKEIVKNNQNLKKESEALKLVVKNISIISELGQKITATLDLDSIKSLLFSSIMAFMDLTYFVVGLYDEKTDSIIYIDAFYKGKKIKISSVSMNDNSSFSAICLKSSKVLIINDLKNEYSKYIDSDTYEKYISQKADTDLNSLIFCPLLINSKAIGVLSVQSNAKNAFTAYQVEMVKSLSSYAAIAINNSLKSMELENLNKKLLHLSENDSLTGIYNRRKFDEYFDDIWNNAIITHQSIALLLIDIDYFKEYNDNYGHLEGDNCIITVANILNMHKNKGYFTARYGGDEFIILLPDSTLTDALEFSEVVQSSIAELNITHEYSKISNIVTLSIGIASTIPSDFNNSNALIKTTDNALYTAKKRGRNQTAYNTN